MKYSNNHLIEVNCGFLFPEETTLWDSTFFGRFYEKIKDYGFNQSEERKGVQITFSTKDNNLSPITTASELEDQIVFRNIEKGLAIILGKGKVSFHCVKGYNNWEEFLNNVIIPYSEQYKSLGLGNGKRQCSIVYLNQFSKNIEESLSDYFTIISSLDKKFGNEVMSTIQRVVSNNDNLLIAKLNSQILNGLQNINFECGAVCINEECMNNQNWAFQANKTHEPILSFFEEIITEKLKKEL